MRTLPLLAVIAFAAGLSTGCRPDMAEFRALKQRVAALESQGAGIQTSKVEIVDKDGKVRASFGLREDGSPELRLVDEKKTNRLLARLHPDGTPILVMWGQEGKGTVYLSVPGQGPPNMMMFDKDGTMKAKLPK